MSDSITPEVFYNTLFPPDELGDYCPVLCHPAQFTSRETGKVIDYYKNYRGSARTARKVTRNPAGWLYCVSTVQPRPDGRVKRTYDDVREAWVFVLDDIGTKAVAPDALPVAPSALLQTSEKDGVPNYQAVYLLAPFDVSGPKGQDYYDACMVSAARAGLSDPGMRSATRVAKMPGAVHSSGFITQVTHWAPERVWELPDLMDALGVEVKPGRRRRGMLKPGKHEVLADVEDPLYRWLVDNWPVHGSNDQWVFIDCPWRDRHTDGEQGSSSTAYSPLEYGRAGRGFKCLHGHCQDRDLLDFITYMRLKGARL